MALVVEADGGARETQPLGPGTVAGFLNTARQAVESVGGSFPIRGAPNEVKDAKPFVQDHADRLWDAGAVRRFHQALVRIDAVFSRFRTSFLGKVSPVHLFWGSFDLAVTRFSGRRAPIHRGGIPNLPDAVTREAYSHEVASAGFWPGEGAGEPMFYAYAYPSPDGFAQAKVRPDMARWDETLGEFLLPYAAIAHADNPEGTLLEFLCSTYEAAADSGGWDRDALECAMGEPGVLRPVHPPSGANVAKVIRGVDHVGLTVPDLDQAVAFLRAAFGCEEDYRIGPFEAADDWMTRRLGVRREARIPVIAVMSRGVGTRLEVFEYEAPDQRREVPSNSDVGAHHIAFYTDDLPSAIARAQSAGGTILDAPTGMTEGPSAGETWVYVRAPWGGQFELVTRATSSGV